MRPSAAGTQDTFARALLDPQALVPGLRAWNGSDPSVRLDVHRNTVITSLVDALACTFPVVQAHLGEECFGAVARDYVRADPPRSPVLALYGEGFASWLRRATPLAELPWLPDLARLEYARVQAYHAADAAVCTAQHLHAAMAQPDRLPGLVLTPLPSVQVVTSAWAVVSLWAAHQDQGRLEELRIDQAEAALVLRDSDDVVIVPVPRPAARFVQALRQARPLGEAVALAGEDLDLPASLALLLRHEALAATGLEGALT